MSTIITVNGDCLVMNINGDNLLFVPTGQGNGIWVYEGAGDLWLELVGTMLILTSGTDKIFAYPANAGWIINGTYTPGTDTFKWPFDSTAWTTYPMHSGLDWGEAPGTNIPIIGPGTVIEVYANSANTFPFDDSEPAWRGNCIVVDHGIIDGIQISSLYAHMLNNPAYSVGNSVVGGQIAGQVGNTGYSNGAHLHFEIIYNGDRLTNSEGGGAERADAWMDAHTDGSHW